MGSGQANDDPLGVLAHTIYERHHDKISTLRRLERLTVDIVIARCTTAVRRTVAFPEKLQYL
jgi:hypothetical protein